MCGWECRERKGRRIGDSVGKGKGDELTGYKRRKVAILQREGKGRREDGSVEKGKGDV